MGTTTTEPRQPAMTALAPFGPVDRATARNLLGMWAHADRLSPADVRAILRRYPPATRQAQR